VLQLVVGKASSYKCINMDIGHGYEMIQLYQCGNS